MGGKWDMPTPESSSEDKASTSKSKWDMPTPAAPSLTETPRKLRRRWDETPSNPNDGQTPFRLVSDNEGINSEVDFLDTEMQQRNRYLTDSDLNELLPSEGYSILEPPVGYSVIMPSTNVIENFNSEKSDSIKPEIAGDDMPQLKQEDVTFFGKLLETEVDEENLQSVKERKLMKIILRIKNGSPQMRRQSMRQITEKVHEFGANMIFDCVLPILMSPSIDSSERHLLIKVVDRVLQKLGVACRGYAYKILVVVEPLLMDENFFARMEARALISNLTKAVGLSSMIACIRPDIDHSDEYVRNTTARTLAVITLSVGIGSIVPFIKAVCASKKSWIARHTGLRTIQQIAILSGCAVLPNIRDLLDCIFLNLDDEEPRIRIMSFLAVSAVAEAAYPYGIESFERFLEPLWTKFRKLRGKGLAAALKACGNIICLMEKSQSELYVQQLIPSLLKEFSSPDDEMKRIVLKVLKQCLQKGSLSSDYVKREIMAEFFKNMWQRRVVSDRKSLFLLLEASIELAKVVGAENILYRIVTLLKHEDEPLRRSACIFLCSLYEKLAPKLIPDNLMIQLFDGLIFSLQEHNVEEKSKPLLGAIAILLQSTSMNCKSYIIQIANIALWRMANKSAKMRQLAADTVVEVAKPIFEAGEIDLICKVSVVFYENLGEEYPEVLASIIKALKEILVAVGSSRMSPSLKDLILRVSPILRNRNEKVQENCVDLIGLIADLSPEAANSREWMRICFELLDLLKAQRKSIRKAATKTFGLIARAVGPHDVLAALLNNLKVQERQNRVCTTVAIAIVAETCAPFTVLPVLMNEYRIPEMNVQNGVLKSLSYMFEHIGELSRDYIYAVTTLLEDALTDRDQVHRQTAAMATKHMSLGVVGFGCEEALVHLMNCILPNLFDANPHLIIAVIESIDSLRLSTSPSIVFQYLIQGLFHPARRVREVYWRMYNNLYIGSHHSLISSYPTDNSPLNMIV